MDRQIKLYSLLGTGIATTLMVLWFLRRKKKRTRLSSWADGDDPFGALKLPRPKHDAADNATNDVNNHGIRQQDKHSPDADVELVLTSSASVSSLSSGPKDAGKCSSYSSLESDETSEFYSPRENPSSDSLASEPKDKIDIKTDKQLSDDDCKSETDLDGGSEKQNVSIHSDHDFHAILLSPVVETHPVDDRMLRHPSEERMTSPVVLTYEESRSPSETELKSRSIYSTYHSIVPPLQPNTGETIAQRE